MRPPRLLVLAFCLIFFPIFLTFYSALTSSPHVSTPSTLAGQATGLHALFSFNLPSSLFPPSAIISLTDENATFFLARPAAFGPLLPEKGLSGRLWVGSGFGERSTGSGKELGCSDIPGWSEGESDLPRESRTGKTGLEDTNADHAPSQSHADFVSGAVPVADSTAQLPNDGTDDHLHHPLPSSAEVDSIAADTNRDSQTPKPKGAHADIQSLQETAEISGQIVLLSRGGCGFLEKVKWAQRRGASALIVGDDTHAGSLVTMYARGDTSNVTIPALFTSYTTAHLLSSLIPPPVRDASVLIDGTKSLSGSETLPTPAASATGAPSSTHQTTPDGTRNYSTPGLFDKLISLLGLGTGGRAKLESNRRPPSSGNINWIPMSLWDEQGTSNNEAGDGGSVGGNKGYSQPKSKASDDGDGFVIGVQDWRDPDLIAPKSSIAAVPTTSTAETNQRKEKETPSASTLKGGSITPGSGEYRAMEKSSVEDKTRKTESRHPATSEGPSESKSWFSRHLLGVRSEAPKSPNAGSKKLASGDLSKEDVKNKEHDGLWVTLTPTSMSTSPFFDTLLVLVISPMLTLSVVYTLLILRSRIRRRRWRAPKSLVERLPVRTYQTMSTPSSSSSSQRSSSPGPVSQTSPLLGAKRSTEPARPRPRSKAEPKTAKRKHGASTWRRKYTGRQVECVVCLEEYIEGQSRVMSLPCGHEFHAECM